MSLSKEQITEIAATISVDFASLAAFIEVESSGKGFSPVTGKIIIQFEPHIFAKGLQAAKVDYTMTVAMENGRKKYTIVSGSKKIVNSVEGQTAEWVAFDTATAIHPRSAKLATSIGLGQVMGFNHAKLGFKTVEEMWSEFEKGEYQQVVGMTFFIKNTPGLLDALKAKNWAKVAMLYNGADYAVNKYDVKLANAYAKYKKIQDAPAGSVQPVTAERSMGPVGSEGFDSTADLSDEEDFEPMVESVLSAHSFLVATPETGNGGQGGSLAKSAKLKSTKSKAAKPVSKKPAKSKSAKPVKAVAEKPKASKALSAKGSSTNAKPRKTANLKSAGVSAVAGAKAGKSAKSSKAADTATTAKPSKAVSISKSSLKAKLAPKPTTSKKAVAPKKPLK